MIPSLLVFIFSLLFSVSQAETIDNVQAYGHALCEEAAKDEVHRKPCKKWVEDNQYFNIFKLPTLICMQWTGGNRSQPSKCFQKALELLKAQNIHLPEKDCLKRYEAHESQADCFNSVFIQKSQEAVEKERRLLKTAH